MMHHKYISKPVEVISSIGTPGAQGSEISRNTDLVLKGEVFVKIWREQDGEEAECRLTCDGQASLRFGLSLLSLVLQVDFVFAL